MLLFHGASELGALSPGLSGFVGNGFVGVSLFFILSGFVLTYTYQGSRATLGEFYGARIARIYPVYLFSLLLAAPIFFKGFIAGGNGERVAPLVLGKLFMIQSWIPWMEHNWNVPSWSLSTEAFFYLLFPVLLPALGLIPTRWRWACIGLLVVLYGFGLALSKSMGPEVSLAPVRDLALFGGGILVGLQFSDGWRAPRWVLPVSSFAALALAMGYDPLPSNGWLKVIFTLLLVGVIGGIASVPPSSRSFLNRPALRRLGEASYALYILHVPIAGMVAFAGSKLGFSFRDPWVLLVYIPVCILASLAVYNLIEVPANRNIRQRLAGSRKPAPVVS